MCLTPDNSILCLQLRNTDTGLTLSDGSAVTYATAVAAIIKLRDTLGLTTSSSVESPLTRTATAYPNAPTDSTEPFLFAVDSNAVAYTRTPKQVSITSSTACCIPATSAEYICIHVATLTEHPGWVAADCD